MNNRKALLLILLASIFASLGITTCMHRTQSDQRFGAIIDNLGGIKLNASGIDANGHPVIITAAPTATSHATNKSYVDTLVAAAIIPARAASTIALPSYVVAGSAGAETLTLSGSVPCPTIDGVTLAVNDAFLLNNGASFTDNGLFDVTTSTGSSCVFTRDARLNSAGEILSTTLKVVEGVRHRGRLFNYINDPALTVGTTMLAWAPVDADNNQTSGWSEEFNTQFNAGTGSIPTGANLPGALPLLVTITGTGTAQTVQTDATATEWGILRLSATTTTGAVLLSTSAVHPPNFFATNDYVRSSGRVSGPSALSDGTDTFSDAFGFGTTTQGTSANAFWVAQNTAGDATHWYCEVRAGGVGNSTKAIGPTVVASTFVSYDMIKYAGETKVHCIFDGTDVGTMTTNVPVNVPIGPIFNHQKSAGNTNARTIDIDYLRFRQIKVAGRSP